MFFLTPRYLKHGRQFSKDARKLLAYKRDLWSAATIADFEKGIANLDGALQDRDRAGADRAAGELEAICNTHLPPVADAGWRENVEVFLVAIVVALGVRTYFLQPFTIPTGSMFPTLNGIIGHPTQEPPPNVLVRVWQAAWNGRTWVNEVAKENETIRRVEEVSRFLFFTYTRVETDKNVYLLHMPLATAQDPATFNLMRRSDLRAGEPIARGYHDTGDHVFVDKMTYHFRTPRRGNVFVFNTGGIQGIRTPDGTSQFYIKRLAGLPCDKLRIDPPTLYTNGQRAEGSAFERVMASQGEYRGYSNGVAHGGPAPLLGSPTSTFDIPTKNYFALGDNSFNSSDSRYWGTVPERNIMGRGVFVYWPFTPHFGGIR